MCAHIDNVYAANMMFECSSVADEEEVDDFDLTELSLTDDEDVAQIRRRLLQQAPGKRLHT
jgi:hypothetical protein